MRVVSIALVRFGSRLPVTVGNARGSWHEREGLLLRLTDEKGRLGQGEACPLPGYSPDSLEDCVVALRSALQASLGSQALRIDLEGPVEAQVRALIERIDPALPAARFALETALLDLIGKGRGLPLHALLSTTPGDTAIPLSALIDTTLIDAPDPAPMLAAARAAQARGITTFKLKVGRAGAFERELEAFRALRNALGDGVFLRFDANGCFPPGDVADRLNALATLNAELVEEPVGGAAWCELGGSPVPLAMDESLRTLARGRLETLVRTGVCAVVVLKPTVLGGLFACLELARQISSWGGRVFVTHTFEGPVAMTAAAALALALPSVVLSTRGPERSECGAVLPPLACGLDPHPGLTGWPPVSMPHWSPRSLLAVSIPGLGLEALSTGGLALETLI